ncbi:MAG: exodeoxyribonuclease V subunit gamma, partial [Acidimicrobiia bacterium]
MTLLIHVGSHPDELVGRLCDMLAAPPDDPLQRELVAVPTRGIERWLTQRIASGLGRRGLGDGICANVEFVSPRRLVREVLTAVPELEASASAWGSAALARSLTSVLDAHRNQPWMWLLDRYLDAADAAMPTGTDQRWRAARKIAGLFGRYARRRPGMVRRWAAGSDVGPRDEPMLPAEQWQPALWRLVRQDIGLPGLPELLPGGLAPIRDGTVELGLPQRLSVYGLTAADPMDLDVFQAVAARADVHLYLLHPSPSLWNETREVIPRLSDGGTLPWRVDDPSRTLARHPLLRSWAQESRELQLSLVGRDLEIGPAAAPEQGPEPGTLLGMVQHEVRANAPDRQVAAADAESLSADRSMQIHVCHGAKRQVEVMRDAILHALADDRTLEPRDIVIMTPDLGVFAPLLEAAFPERIRSESADAADADLPDAADGLPDLRVRIADRAPAVTNPLVRFVAMVLEIARSRLEAAAVRELVDLPVVQQRFGYDDETAAAIGAVIADTNIRWGLDAAHRAAWAAGAFDDHTWGRGLDRALVGAFYADSTVRDIATIAPLDGVEGQDARPVGLLAQILDRIVAVRALLGEDRAHSEWGPAIAAAVRLLAAPAWGEEWQWGQLDRLLDESFPTPTAAVLDPEISLAEATLVVAGWVQDVPSPLHFRTGDITVCTLVPMRSVPYRVVCLLGMDDERFPRSSRDDGDDLLLGHELVGDADRGAEDRQLLLDALMAAGDRLMITYSGRDELMNAVYPPAVPIAELEDVIISMVGADGLERIVTHHPLQPFSELNFTPGRLGVPGPWGFDPMQLDGAVAVQGRSDGPGTAPASLGPGDEPPDLRLDDLIAFLVHPARHFVRARLGFTIPETGEISDDALPVDLDALAKWGLTDRLLTGLLDGRGVEELVAHERGGDALPPGWLGADDLEEATRRAEDLRTAADGYDYDRERHVQIAGTVLVGGLAVEGSVLADTVASRIDVVTPSRLKGRQRLRSFVQLLFLTALDPVPPWHALLIGRHPTTQSLRAISIQQLGADDAGRKREADRLLAGLIDLYVE